MRVTTVKSSDLKPGFVLGYMTCVSKTARTLSSGRRMPAWSMRCVCGKIVVAMTTNITAGKHQSCGCKHRALICEARGFRGDAKRPEYRIYRQMLDRCYLPSAPNFRWYGGKGVTVCERWREGEAGETGFQCFIADMGERPAGLTLERNDPREPYGPANCCWATWAEQASNKREHYLSPFERAQLRKRRSDIRQGEKSPLAKLTDDQVAVIKRRIALGARTNDLAKAFGVAPQTISGIKHGRKWAHVQPGRAA